MENKLIIEESFLEKVATKMKDQPVYSDSNGKLFKPGVIDFLDDDIESKWQPLNEEAKQLVLSVEACKDIMFYKDSFLISSTRKRAMRRMVVPICNLIDIVRKIISIFNKNEKLRDIRESSWPQVDKNIYKKISKRINKINAKSTIRRIRNKQSAHLDNDLFHEEMIKFQATDVLEPLGDCLIILMLSTNYPSEFFHWVRFLGIIENNDKIVETMYSYPLCTRWITDKAGYAKDLDSFNLAADPRHEIREIIQNTVNIYNEIIRITNIKLSEIYLVPTEELRKKERDDLVQKIEK